MQAFDLDVHLEEFLQQLQMRDPHRKALDDPLDVLTFTDFSQLF